MYKLGDDLKTPAVVLVSGGLDSAVTLANAIERGYAARALTIDYGQRHRVELMAAQKVANSLGAVDHKVISLDLRAFGGSALTDELSVPKGSAPGASESIPVTYVPARNTIFLSLALSWAEVLDARDIFIGVSSVDYSGYPDCRPGFIDQFERLANMGTRAGDQGVRFKVHAPLANLSKGETVRMGERLGVDFGLTWTCYDPTDLGQPCKECESCQLRARGFAQAGLVDPLLSR